MAERTCANCGDDIEEFQTVEHDGLAFCSEDCADEYEGDDDEDDEDDEDDDFDDEDDEDDDFEDDEDEEEEELEEE